MAESEAGKLVDRLVKLEEHAGFQERLVEQLSEEIRGLGERLRSLERRLAQTEQRQQSLSERIVKPAAADADPEDE
ncbi:MAG: SlyX family protein [Phycisphaerae bacterium]|nr:SlyX family protein [Phycisphaerae bacterium]